MTKSCLRTHKVCVFKLKNPFLNRENMDLTGRTEKIWVFQKRSRKSDLFM